MCGGTVSAVRLMMPVNGLSPRVRGNRWCWPLAHHRTRSIPACAGEPSCWTLSGRLRTVYPRVCGGTCDARPARPQRNGLSPRVRGNRLPQKAEPAAAGSIPACAGEPLASAPHQRTPQVYPRVCGGTLDEGEVDARITGLSPRVRGNLADAIAHYRQPRSIPACAGEPAVTAPAWHSHRVYPRVCGGTMLANMGIPGLVGLSPRVRGNLIGSTSLGVVVRSIPACAGEPTAERRGGCGAGVYPRVCGGTRFGAASLSHGWGLSPRVRGNRQGRGHRFTSLGSIPACAGEPP